MKRKYKRKRGPVRAKKVTFDGIKFASGLERYMYQALKKAKIQADYRVVRLLYKKDLCSILKVMKDKAMVKAIW